MKTRDIMSSLQRHWEAARAGDIDIELDIYAEDAVCDFPQSGESASGIESLKALRVNLPEKPKAIDFLRILGSGNLWVTECVVTFEAQSVFTVSIMEFKDGKVFHETQYFAPHLQAPAWHARWTSPTSEGGPEQT